MQRRWWLEAKPAQTELDVADFDFAQARLVENSDSAACPLPPPIILPLPFPPTSALPLPKDHTYRKTDTAS